MSMFTNAAGAAVEEAEVYIDAVLALVGDRDPIEVLEELPAALVEITRTMTDSELREPEAPGKWSGAVLLAHLADSELVWACRLRTVLAEVDPVLTGYDQDRWVEQLGYRDRAPAVSLEEIEFLRRGNLRLLKGLSTEQLERSGVHSERESESVGDMVGLYAGHDLVHRSQFERIRSSVKA